VKKFKVKHFKDEQGLTAFVDKSLGRRKRLSIQTTQSGFTVCY
jgi:hypothetical protein